MLVESYNNNDDLSQQCLLFFLFIMTTRILLLIFPFNLHTIDYEPLSKQTICNFIMVSFEWEFQGWKKVKKHAPLGQIKI